VVCRIDTSSSSVVGITGVRGAGKSSLAKKVLNACDVQGYFTLLIPSPTGYEPREFLLAIFQRVGEHVTDRLRQIVDAADDLTTVGKRKATELRRRAWVVLAGLLLLIGVSVGPYYYIENRMFVQSTSAEIQRLQSQLEKIQEQQPPTIEPSGTAQEDSLTSQIESRRRVLNELSPVSRLLATNLGVLFVLVFYSVIIFTVIYLVRLRNKLRAYRKAPKSVGLYYECQNFLELLKYQGTMTSGKELGVLLKGISGKSTTGRQLVERPLSLPGLTAICAEFLSKVSEVFAGKVVICIDELDKETYDFASGAINML